MPADGKLVECASLKVDESALTGESLSVEKSLDEVPEGAALGDQTNRVFSGRLCNLRAGAAYEVTGIGMGTEVGKIASLLKNTSEKRNTPPGKPGRFREEALHTDHHFLRDPVRHQHPQRRPAGRCLPLRGCPCSGSDPGGFELYRDHRAFLRYTEDGQGARHHPQAPGSGGTGKCVHRLFPIRQVH